MTRAKYIGFLFLLPILASLFLPIHDAIASELSFSRGQRLEHNLSVCLDKEVAISIVEADEKEGLPAAAAIFQANDRCLPLPVVGPTVGKVVKSVQVKRAGKNATARVVEIVNDGEVIGYFLTSAKVNEINS